MKFDSLKLTLLILDALFMEFFYLKVKMYTSSLLSYINLILILVIKEFVTLLLVTGEFVTLLLVIGV